MASAIFDTSLLDLPLAEILSVTENLYLCSALPTTFAQASSTYALGAKASPTMNPIEDGTDGGRKVVVPQIVDGISTGTGMATHMALTDNSTSRLLVTKELPSQYPTSAGSEFILESFEIEFRPE
jgi:hypothetical protein